MDDITITGYSFIVADNTSYLPSAAGAQNETLGPGKKEDWEDAMLVASGLLPRLIAQAREERLGG